MEYHDTQVLTDYVWEHFPHLMTPFERQVDWAILLQKKAAASNGPATYATEIVRKCRDQVRALEIEVALADGPDAFRRRVCARVLAEAGAQVFVNRCPRCHRIVRTPKAKQCFWCGHDWHGKTPAS